MTIYLKKTLNVNVLFYVLLSLLVSSCSGGEIDNQTLKSNSLETVQTEPTKTNLQATVSSADNQEQGNSIPVDPLMWTPAMQAILRGNSHKITMSLENIKANFEKNKITSDLYDVEQGIDSGDELKINIHFNKNYTQKKNQLFIQSIDEPVTNISYLCYTFTSPQGVILDKKDIKVIQALIGATKKIKNEEEIANKLVQIQNDKVVNKKYEYFDGLVTTTLSINGSLLELNTVPKGNGSYFYIYKSNNKPEKY